MGIKYNLGTSTRKDRNRNHSDAVGSPPVDAPTGQSPQRRQCTTLQSFRYRLTRSETQS